MLRRLSEVSCGLRTGLGAGLGEEGSEILRDVRIVKGRVPPKETAVRSPVDFAQWLSSAAPAGLKVMLQTGRLASPFPALGEWVNWAEENKESPE